MSWAARRRFIISFIVGALIVALLAVVLISVLYQTPSCVDGVQNQAETGVDCGGPCQSLCLAEQQLPTVLFTKAVKNGEGRVDAVAEIENKNFSATAKNVLYRITFYGADQILLREVAGTIDLPPSTIVPVFVPGVSSGNQAVAGAFLNVASSSLHWFSASADTRVAPIVSMPKLGGTASAPRVEAVLANKNLSAFTNVRVIVFVYDPSGEIIAASSTVVPTIPAGGTAPVLFTWNGPFTSVPARIKITPIIPPL
jgi:hypothetical protein